MFVTDKGWYSGYIHDVLLNKLRGYPVLWVNLEQYSCTVVLVSMP